ncbi:DoxX family protein [Glycomyces salinus]|uniref:DoxX family protein n=1 Tax=Glycomyces salinus TaxID=980294 RepID=UPI0018EC10C6|nr:DoxX family protein [Glycomyces salinus]
MEARQRNLGDLSVLVARLGVGIILLAYGWQKLADWGLSTTAEIMSGGGVPLPQVSAYATTFGELLAGSAIILGVAVRPAAIGAALLMTGAIVFVNGASGLYAEQGGYAFPLAVGAASLLLAVTGSGRFGLDPLLKPVYDRMRPVASAVR